MKHTACLDNNKDKNPVSSVSYISLSIKTKKKKKRESVRLIKTGYPNIFHGHNFISRCDKLLSFLFFCGFSQIQSKLMVLPFTAYHSERK